MNNETAQQAAARQFKLTEALLIEINMMLIVKKKKMEYDPKSWGHVGDMQSVNERLTLALHGLGGATEEYAKALGMEI